MWPPTGRKLFITTHRRENLGSAMENIGDALAVELAVARPDLLILLPAHRNPLVREAVLPRVETLENVLVTEPLSYGEFTTVMAASDVLLTDSGGIQEEAPSLGKPVLVMRENTERPEALTAGSVALVVDRTTSSAEVSRLFDDARGYESMARAINPYGDGQRHRDLSPLSSSCSESANASTSSPQSARLGAAFRRSSDRGEPEVHGRRNSPAAGHRRQSRCVSGRFEPGRS